MKKPHEVVLHPDNAKIGLLYPGDKITTIKDGVRITITIVDIGVNAVSGDTMIYINHYPSDKYEHISINNLVLWFTETTWERVE